MAKVLLVALVLSFGAFAWWNSKGECDPETLRTAYAAGLADATAARQDFEAGLKELGIEVRHAVAMRRYVRACGQPAAQRPQFPVDRDPGRVCARLSPPVKAYDESMKGPREQARYCLESGEAS